MNEPMIPYEKISPDDKKQIMQVLIVGNTLAEQHHKIIKGNKKQPSRRKFRVELYKLLKDRICDITVFGHFIPKSDVEKFMAVKNLEWRLLTGYARLLHKRSNHWYRINKNNTPISKNDLFEEAVLGFLDAVHGYKGVNKKGKKIKFLTYAWHCIDHAINRDIWRSRLIPLGSSAAKLVYKYQRIAADEAYLSFEEICDRLELNEKQRLRLTMNLNKIKNASSLADDDEEPKEIFLDNPDSMENGLFPEHLDAISRANLTPWEEKVLHAFLFDGRGWATRVAAANINPVTGQCYSREAPHVALERLKKKILDAQGT